MKLQRQTVFGGAHAPVGERGNCFATCVACILGVDVKHVPNFMDAPGDGGAWFDAAHKWMHPRGISLICWEGEKSPVSYAPQSHLDCVLIASGKSPRGDYLHSVLWKHEKMVHDPHPSDGGIIGPPKDWCLLILFDHDRFARFRSEVMLLDGERVDGDLTVEREQAIYHRERGIPQAHEMMEVLDAMSAIREHATAERERLLQRIRALEHELGIDPTH